LERYVERKVKFYNFISFSNEILYNEYFIYLDQIIKINTALNPSQKQPKYE